MLFCLITWNFLHSGNIKSLELFKKILLPTVLFHLEPAQFHYMHKWRFQVLVHVSPLLGSLGYLHVWDKFSSVSPNLHAHRYKWIQVPIKPVHFSRRLSGNIWSLSIPMSLYFLEMCTCYQVEWIGKRLEYRHFDLLLLLTPCCP